jgi:hypothetical protein
MNGRDLANELADLLEVDSWYKLVTREEIATMLRQQQAEIETLNQRIERMIENQSHHEGIAHAGGFEAGYQAAKAKTLTDEEIIATFNYFCATKDNAKSAITDIGYFEESMILYGRLILETLLRKAQEK